MNIQLFGRLGDLEKSETKRRDASIDFMLVARKVDGIVVVISGEVSATRRYAVEF